MKTALLLLIIACGYLYVSRADYQSALAQQTRAEVRLPKSRCPERDYLGRHIVASYYARSDTIQTLRCSYSKRTWT